MNGKLVAVRIPPDKHAALFARAKKNRRSLGAQYEWEHDQCMSLPYAAPTTHTPSKQAARKRSTNKKGKH